MCRLNEEEVQSDVWVLFLKDYVERIDQKFCQKPGKEAVDN